MVVLKGVPVVITARLLTALAEMGHGDELVLADANFPAHSCAAGTPGGVIQCDGNDIPTILEAILTLFPLDPAVRAPCALMAMMDEHKAAGWKTPIWDVYKSTVAAAEGKPIDFEEVERFAFYERAKKAYAIVVTGEKALYGNLIIKKGIIGTKD